MSLNDPMSQLVRSLTTALDSLQRRTFNLEIQETYSNHVHQFSEMQTGGECACGSAKWPGGQVHFCVDCLKVGEASGHGTGTAVYCNKADGTWRRIRDDAVASA